MKKLLTLISLALVAASTADLTAQSRYRTVERTQRQVKKVVDHIRSRPTEAQAERAASRCRKIFATEGLRSFQKKCLDQPRPPRAGANEKRRIPASAISTRARKSISAR